LHQEVKRNGIPVYLKRHGTLCCQNILCGICQWIIKFHCNDNPYRTALLLLVIPLVVVDSGGMGHDDVVGCDIGFPVGVAAIAGPERCGAVVGRVLAEQVGELGEQVGLVERRPELDPVTERLEAHVRVVVELLPANKSFLDQGK
jgi:hypothetical protein